MDPVQSQYEALPYPHRDPAEERRRLIGTTPSEPAQVDHFLFRGRRDWSAPFRALVAGGGTGDAAICMAYRLAEAGCPGEVHYLDMSSASRRVAEDRAAVRGLDNIVFHTADLAVAEEIGPFDYIDCCGVLHHLPDPPAGFRALRRALAPGGGMGLMVYGRYGRSGVYETQDALRRLLPADAPLSGRIAAAREIVAAAPDSNLLKRNSFIQGWQDSETEFLDLLLHAQDRAYTVPELVAALGDAALAPVGFPFAALYDPAEFLPRPHRDLLAGMDVLERAAVAELLRGDLTRHVVYVAARDEAADRTATGRDPGDIPRMRTADTAGLARALADTGRIEARMGALALTLSVPRESALALATVGGRSLGEMAAALGLDWVRFQLLWAPLHRVLTRTGLMVYSRGMDMTEVGPMRRAAA